MFKARPIARNDHFFQPARLVGDLAVDHGVECAVHAGGVSGFDRRGLAGEKRKVGIAEVHFGPNGRCDWLGGRRMGLVPRQQRLCVGVGFQLLF